MIHFTKVTLNKNVFLKLTLLTKLVKDFYNILIAYTEPTNEEMKAVSHVKSVINNSHVTWTVLPKAKADSTLSADGHISSLQHTHNSKQIFNIILFKNRLVV